MTVGRRAVLGGMTAALALPLVRTGQLGAPGFAARTAGVATVWGLAFWSCDAGEPARTFTGTPRRVISPPAWHPEFL